MIEIHNSYGDVCMIEEGQVSDRDWIFMIEGREGRDIEPREEVCT